MRSHNLHQRLSQLNRPFPSCLELLFQSEAKCEIFHMKISLHSPESKTHFHIKGFALYGSRLTWQLGNGLLIYLSNFKDISK